MSLLAEVAARLEARGVRFALVGAEALALRGVSRATIDRDLLTTDPRVLDVAFWLPLAEGGNEVEVRHGDSRDALAGVLRFRAPDERPVDLMVGRPGWLTQLVERAAAMDLDELRLGVPSAADLVLLKLFAGGPQDAWDVTQLLASPERGALRAEVEERLAEPPADCAALWRRILEERP